MKVLLVFFIPILEILEILSESTGKRDLKFVPIITNSSRKNEYFMRNEPIEIDAFTQNQIFISIEKLKPLKFTCHASDLKNEYPLVNAYLCMKETLQSKENCIDVKNKDLVKFETGQFSPVFYPLKGFEANLIIKSSKYFRGYMYCILENSVDRIISNQIEFQNFNYYSSLITTSYNKISSRQQRKVDNGNIFDCGTKIDNKDNEIPNWIRPLLKNQFIWFLCPDKTSNDYCYEPIWKTLTENEHYKVFSNYSIQLFDNAFEKINNFRLQCNDADQPLYSIYEVSANPNSIYISTHNFQIYTPELNDIEIREGKCETHEYKLTAAYVAGASTFTWHKDNVPLSNDFNYDGHTLTFPKVIKQSHQGKYILEVYQRYPSISRQFEFNVKVLTIPKFSSGYEVPEVVYVMSGRSLNLTARFTGNDIKTSLEINNFPISTDNKIQQKIDLNNFRKKHAYLSEMIIRISEISDKSFKEIVYKIEQISGLWFKEGHSHRVTFLASNGIGVIRTSTLVKAIEKPRWKTNLSQYQCTEKCYSDEPHNFKCAIFSEEYASVGLKVNYQWRINGIDIVTLFSEELRSIYFTIHQESLTLNKISTENNVRDLRIIEKLQNATLSCSASILITKKLINGEEHFEEIYNSWYDPIAMPFVQTNVSVIARSILQSGSSNLIWIICVPFILITIITTIIVCSCYFGKSGKTYDIDHNERIAGKDPEQETFDSLYFKHYNREEENGAPVMTDHISWSDQSYKSDVGEIDNYDTENDIFDEGSIIGQYANESHK